jgi:hypothetical protein
MTDYAYVTGGTIAPGRLPGCAKRLDTGEWVGPNGGLIAGTKAEREACGWYEITDTPRSYTADELAAQIATTNEDSLRTEARAAFAGLRQITSSCPRHRAQLPRREHAAPSR